MKFCATRIRFLLLVAAVAACTARTPTPSIAPVAVALVPSSPSAASPATPVSSPITECPTFDLGISARGLATASPARCSLWVMSHIEDYAGAGVIGEHFANNGSCDAY
jgi:hypothetical protein